MHEDDFAGWCVIDSIGGGDTVVKHDYLTGTSANDYHPDLGVHLFLNYCASFLHGLYTKDTVVQCYDSHQESSLKDTSSTVIAHHHEFYVKYEEPFGDYKAQLGN